MFPQASIGLLRDAVGTIEPFLAARTCTAVVTERFVFPLVASASFMRVFVAIRRIMVGRCGFHVGHAGSAADSREAGEAAV